MILNKWMTDAYFSDILSTDSRSYTALELFVEDLHANKHQTIQLFMRHHCSEEFLCSLFRLLGCKNARSDF